MTTWKLSVSIGVFAGTAAILLLPGAPATAAGPEAEPFAFIENHGQWDAATEFLARGGPMVARFEKDAIVLQFCLNDVVERYSSLAEYGGENIFLGIDTRDAVSGVHGFLLRSSRF